MNLIDFLLARIGEDEVEARVAGDLRAYKHEFPGGAYLEDARTGHRIPLPFDGRDVAELQWLNHAVRHLPGRVLAECEAKRRIVERYAHLHDHGDSGDAQWVLPLLALAYADHPDYREEWRP